MPESHHPMRKNQRTRTTTGTGWRVDVSVEDAMVTSAG
jgi:hypothetical protein